MNTANDLAVFLYIRYFLFCYCSVHQTYFYIVPVPNWLLSNVAQLQKKILYSNN